MIDNDPIIGREYRVIDRVPALCCEGSLEAGNTCKVEKQTSKNRLMISLENSRGGRNYHKVKRSTFKMNAEEI